MTFFDPQAYLIANPDSNLLSLVDLAAPNGVTEVAVGVNPRAIVDDLLLGTMHKPVVRPA